MSVTCFIFAGILLIRDLFIGTWFILSSHVLSGNGEDVNIVVLCSNTSGSPHVPQTNQIAL